MGYNYERCLGKLMDEYPEISEEDIRTELSDTINWLLENGEEVNDDIIIETFGC